MKINFFLKKIYEEYNIKKINDDSILERCLEAYISKNIHISILYYCWLNNILIEFLININKSVKYITGFNQLVASNETFLPSYEFKDMSASGMRQEKIIFWDKHRHALKLEEACLNIADAQILDMLVVDMSFKSQLIENNDYKQTIKDLEKVVDAHYFRKSLLFFLLEKNLLLEFFLNLHIKFTLYPSIRDITDVNSIYYAINVIGIKFPNNVPDLMSFWFAVDSEYTSYKKDPLKYFYSS